MKHLNRYAALLVILLLLSGCGKPQTDGDRTVEFYYVLSEINFEIPEIVITPETREPETNAQDLPGLLNLYMQGPVTDTLRSPFPDGTTVVQISDQGEYLEVVLSDRLADLTGIELTLACGCIAKTCMDLTEATEVRISAENTTLDGVSHIAITADSIMLFDDSVQ